MADCPITRFQAIPAGFTSSLDFAMYFNQWASERGNDPSVSDIRDHFEVSRATAFRWRRAYRDALERNAARAA